MGGWTAFWTLRLHHNRQIRINGSIVGNMAITEMTQTVKVVIDGNRLWSSQGCQHAQEMLEHRS
jgi:hypothetical protein